MTEEKQKKFKKPRFLRGMFSAIIALTLTILLLAWAIINYQVEQLVAKRTSEYAHSIAQIAANSSADALLSGDALQLKMLVENVAKDPYIRSATIFAEDGLVVAQFPEDESIEQPLNDQQQGSTALSTETSSETEEDLSQTGQPDDEQSLLETEEDIQALEQKAQAYIQSQNDIPFIEKIVYQDVTAGWFKISLNRQLLEQNFRESLQRSQNLIIAISVFLFVVLLFVVIRYEKRVKKIVTACHRLIQVNSPQIPYDRKQWLASLQELSETRFQSLAEHPQPANEENRWVKSERMPERVFCYCQFAMREQEDEKTAASISLAEQYLQAAVQAYGVQSQGDVLSGCLIPFVDSHDEEEAVIEAVSLLFVVSELLASLELEIKMKGFIGKGTLLTLENERGVISGISLSNRLQEKINKLGPQVQYGHISSLAFEQETLQKVGSFEAVNLDENTTNLPVFLLESLNDPIKQQTNRQIQYIISDINS